MSHTDKISNISTEQKNKILCSSSLFDQWMTRINKFLSNISQFVLILISSLVFIQMFSRFFFHYNIPALIEFSIDALVIFPFLVASYVFQEKGHITVNVFTNKFFNQIQQRVLNILVLITSLFFPIVLFWKGTLWAINAFERGYMTTSVLPYPKGFLISAMALGTFTMILEIIRQAWSEMNRLITQDLVQNKNQSYFNLLLVPPLIFLFSIAFSLWFYLQISPIGGILILLTVLIFFKMPIFIALGFAGTFGTIFILGSRGLSQIPITAYMSMESLTLVALPLFIIGGLILEQSGIIESLFAFLEYVFRGFMAGLPLAVTTLGAIFCAITGSTTAATSVVSAVALPHMLERGYSKKFSIGLIAGSTVGTLIPPSLAAVIYAVITGDSVAELFVALIGPALVLFSLYIVYILFLSFQRPELVIEKEKQFNLRLERTKKIKITSLLMPAIWGFVMPLIILGGIYFGVFTPTESASALVVYAILVAKLIRKKDFSIIMRGIFNGTKIAGMILNILVGAGIFSIVISQLRVSRVVVNLIVDQGLGVIPVTLIIFIVLLLLGMFLNAAPIIAITLPVFYPLAKAVGINSLVLAVFYLIVLEIGALTLPVGVNLFAISAVSGDPVENIFRYCLPFIIIMLITIMFIFIFPDIVTWLPATMYRFR
ncbi:MAG: hypothetical protein Kow00103_10840 [Candidatus Caldatribacteriota bacterium]